MLQLLAAWDRFRSFVTFWFVRIAWLPTLAWGLYDAALLVFADIAPDARERLEEDATIRTALGVVLFLIWLFAVRTFGPLTLNQGGRNERA